MKTRRIFINSLFACTLAVGHGLFLSDQKAAQAQSTTPYIVLVNGYNNCCAWGITDRFPSINAEIRSVPYSNFSDRGSSGNTSDDSAFLRDGADFINNLDRNRPLILIGHSFGGDSVLKLLPRINRRMQFVAVIDPVRTAGFRASLKALNVPSNVDYFFNRWQENVPFPNDFGTSGSIPCNAGTCDQDSQNIARNADFSPVTMECSWSEVTCPGFVAPNPLRRKKEDRAGRKGRKQVRVSHQDLPKDAFIQKDLGNKIQRQIAAFRPPQPSGDYLVCITNKTNILVNYRMNWSNESQQFQIGLKPKDTWRHWRNNSTASVKFSFNSGENNKTYNLPAGATTNTSNCNSGKRYWVDFENSSKNSFGIFSTP